MPDMLTEFAGAHRTFCSCRRPLADIRVGEQLFEERGIVFDACNGPVALDLSGPAGQTRPPSAIPAARYQPSVTRAW